MKRIVPFVLIGIGIALFFGSGGWFDIKNKIAHPAAVVLPDQLAGLEMTVYKTGAQAAADFEDLHDQQFPLTSGAIGIYGDHKIIVWAAGAPLNFMAASMVVAMREKILQGGSSFTPVDEFDKEGRTVYVLEGMGQTHYYFRSNNLVIWLAAEPALADVAINQILEDYP